MTLYRIALKELVEKGSDVLREEGIIGAGAMLLFAPLLLRPLPDSFVNGRGGLLVFSAGTAVLALLLWRPLA